jgi:hypothetical protein
MVRLVLLAVAPALGAAFLAPAKNMLPAAFWGGRVEGSSTPACPGEGGVSSSQTRLFMSRTGVQEKLEKVLLKNALLNKQENGYTIVVEESQYEEGYGAVVESAQAEAFSELELKSMYGADYSGPFGLSEVRPALREFEMPSFARGQIVKGIVVRPRALGWISG